VLDWFEVDLGFTKLLFIQTDSCVVFVFVADVLQSVCVCVCVCPHISSGSVSVHLCLCFSVSLYDRVMGVVADVSQSVLATLLL